MKNTLVIHVFFIIFFSSIIISSIMNTVEGFDSAAGSPAPVGSVPTAPVPAPAPAAPVAAPAPVGGGDVNYKLGQLTTTVDNLQTRVDTMDKTMTTFGPILKKNKTENDQNSKAIVKLNEPPPKP